MYKPQFFYIYLSITVSEIQRDICEKNRHFIIPLAFDAPVRGVPVGIAPPRFVRKNENGLATTGLKNFEDTFIRFGATHERDERTHGHRMLTWAALMHRIPRQKYKLINSASHYGQSQTAKISK